MPKLMGIDIAMFSIALGIAISVAMGFALWKSIKPEKREEMNMTNKIARVFLPSAVTGIAAIAAHTMYKKKKDSPNTAPTPFEDKPRKKRRHRHELVPDTP